LSCYFQDSKLEGVNPPRFEIYFRNGISGMGGIVRFRGLDKVFPNWEKADGARRDSRIGKVRPG